MKNLRKRLSHWIKFQKEVFKALRRTKVIAEMPSYYPEFKRKSYNERLIDINEWAKRYGEVNEFYTLYGLDIDGSDSENFIDYKTFMETRNNANQIMKWGGSQTVLLRDKFLFYKYMKSNGMPLPEVFLLVKDGVFYDSDFNVVSKESLIEEKDYFIKDIDGECASFVKHINSYENFLQIRSQLDSGSYIFQKKIVQHHQLAELNPCAINTLRIVTINKNGNPYVLTSLLRVGTRRTGNVDNWAAGGLAIGIEESGYLKEYGFYKPIYGTKANIHPDTGIRFEEFQVPMYKEALTIACEAHKTFYGLRAIGWDIAITEDGPMFIEGNDNFEITLQQACDRPLKREWLEAMN